MNMSAIRINPNSPPSAYASSGVKGKEKTVIDKAIEKITKEAMDIDDPIAFAIEEHLTEICTNSSIAMKILEEDKKLSAVHEKLWAEARKRKKGNCAFIPPKEAHALIDEYYGIAPQVIGQPVQPAERTNVLDLF